MSCEALFKPISINTLTLKNRVIMGSMHVGLEGLENGVEKLTEFYRLRAKYNVGLIVTGGAAVNKEGSGGLDFMTIYEEKDVERWKPLAAAIHNEGAAIALQLFHAGRYAYKTLTGMDPVAPSSLKSPINPDVPKELSHGDILKTIEDFATGARSAKEAGFDAIEIMGSEGYLINQFVSPVTNKRKDAWGGSFENRIAFSLNIVKAVREAVGRDYPIIFRMSGLDLIENSTTEEETFQWAQALEKAGVDLLNVGIGWHESRVPTISMKVPRMNFVPVAEGIRQHVNIPVVASNRINDPRDANRILEKGTVDLVSMARPFLADPKILAKSLEGRFDEINTCIACNQACLDHVFEGQPASCLVNPEAGRETELSLNPTFHPKKVLVIGGGPAGLEVSRVAAERGHSVTLVDQNGEIGGQLNYSKRIPGKEEFYETLRYYRVQLELLGVKVILNKQATANSSFVHEADEIVIATGIKPRIPNIPGIDNPSVVSYRDVFEGIAPYGKEVVIIGGGGIACDLALFLKEKATEKITLLQRGKSFARGIGKTTRWATLMELRQKGVEMIGGIESYNKMEGATVFFSREGKEHIISGDTVILASGQLVNNELADQLKRLGKSIHVIGGAKHALGLDAKNAIYDGAIVGRKI
ncbi:2,4-dienoyl-CoA reductase (NADPH2) [Evansella vedderi]|uniref:2,4-dienoyl-CoA reductase (NADPH2) n=1 Tax=Evansella vedderi TaxID=38282 RepID=A0ABU0A1N7_9BACI|nr:FAD-dependent oxidoreductase [Evansella vedderi]MDQ0257407.1 2,4-dienoyl-CoA reductase (NADPH2) [Evansella vedderi]